MRGLAVLVIGVSWLTGWVTAGFEANGLAVCPPVVEFSRQFLVRAAEELAMFTEGAEMRSDYALMREQVSSCG